MVLKVQINGSKKTLTSPGRAPLTFINGVKKRLVKGITFINGKKVVLWDAHNMQIDYISGMNDLLAYIPTVVCANKQKIILTGNDKVITRLNVANTSSPFVDSAVNNGLITSYSKFDSASSTNLIFYGRIPGAKNNQATFNKIQINPDTLAVSVDSSYSWSYATTVNGTVSPVKMGSSNWWSIASYTTAGVYVNNNKAYTFTQYSTNQVSRIDSTMLKLNDSQCVGVLFDSDKGKGIGSYTSGSVTALVTNKLYSNLLICNDGNYLAAGPSGTGLYRPNGTAVTTIAAPSGYNHAIIGQIRDIYYIVQEPAPTHDTPASGVTLILLNADGTVKERKSLNLKAVASSVVNVNTYGSHIKVIPHISKTGYLAFYWNAKNLYLTSDDRIVRIEGY